MEEEYPTMKKSSHALTLLLSVFVLIGGTGCSTTLSTREKGALTGAGLGALAGAIIGSATGHAGAGAAIGGAVGLGGGALIGDRMQTQEERRREQQRQMDENQAELDRQRRELEALKRQDDEYASAKGKAHPPYFMPEERDTIRDYFAGYSGGLPPGLAKRGDDLPPGLLRQLRRNGTLPPGLQKRLEPLPVDLERRLPSIPDIWRRVIIGSRIILLDRRTNEVLDLFRT